MGIVNARNAVFGWAVWNVAKRVMQMKAKQVVRGKQGGGRRARTLVPAAAAVAGAALLARRLTRGRDGTNDE